MALGWQARIVMGAALALLGGCASTDKADSDEPGAEKTHYVLKLGDTIPHPKPLPARTDVMVEWHYSNGATSLSPGFRGWDFDGDTRFEMVEVLSDEGQRQAMVFDFDGDGRIDMVKDLAK